MTSSCAEKNPVLLRVASPNCHSYPPPMAIYENVVASPQVFMDTLKKLHAGMRTKFRVPILGGKELNLHHLFVEVTSRGGMEKVVREKRWKEVKSVLNFPSSAKNISSLLQKHYNLLLFHYERVYYFKEMYWTPSPYDHVLQQVSHATVPPQGYVLLPSTPEIEVAMPQSLKIETTFPEEPLIVSGVIDGKFESGYTITMKIGSEDFKGFLYHQVPINEELQNQNLPSGKVASTTEVKCEDK